MSRRYFASYVTKWLYKCREKCGSAEQGWHSPLRLCRTQIRGGMRPPNPCKPYNSTMRRADEFLQLLNELDDWLKSHTDRRQRGFTNRLDALAHRNATVDRHRAELREYAELRNAIVHYREYPERIIADPLPEAVERLAEIVTAITNPPRLLPRFRRAIRSFDADAPLLDALEFMREQDHTQVPVQDGKRLTLLTSDGITRWLAQAGARPDLGGVRIADVLAFERERTHLLLSGNATVEEARQAFLDAIGRGIRMRAVLVTQNGKSGPVLGIVTPSDLLSE